MLRLGRALCNSMLAINNASATEGRPQEAELPGTHTFRRHIAMQKPQEEPPHLCLLSSVPNRESQQLCPGAPARCLWGKQLSQEQAARCRDLEPNLRSGQRADELFLGGKD